MIVVEILAAGTYGVKSRLEPFNLVFLGCGRHNEGGILVRVLVLLIGENGIREIAHASTHRPSVLPLCLVRL